jgi:hypothetical protein
MTHNEKFMDRYCTWFCHLQSCAILSSFLLSFTVFYVTFAKLKYRMWLCVSEYFGRCYTRFFHHQTHILDFKSPSILSCTSSTVTTLHPTRCVSLLLPRPRLSCDVINVALALPIEYPAAVSPSPYPSHPVTITTTKQSYYPKASLWTFGCGGNGIVIIDYEPQPRN